MFCRGHGVLLAAGAFERFVKFNCFSSTPCKGSCVSERRRLLRKSQSGLMPQAPEWRSLLKLGTCDVASAAAPFSVCEGAAEYRPLGQK